MQRWSRLSRLWRRLPALVGLAGSVGAALPVQAVPQRSLELRVAEARRQLAGEPGSNPATTAQGGAEVAQANQWNNWPNFNNWANWANG